MSVELENHIANGTRLLWDMQDPENAVDEFSRALAMDPHCLIAFVYRHFAYGDLKMWSRALADLNQAIRLCSDDFRLYDYRSDVHTQLRDYSSAHDDVSTAIALYGLFPAELLAGDILDLEGAEILDPSELIEDDDGLSIEVAAVGSDSIERPSPTFMLADEDESAEQLDRLLHLLWKRGFISLELRQLEEAVENYNRVIEMRPEDACARNNRGLAYMRMAMYEEALADFNSAILLNPAHPDHHNSRARLYFLTGQTELALLDSQVALEACDCVFDPNLGDDMVGNDRAEALVNLGRYQEALDTVKTVLAIRTDEPETYSIMADALCGLGQDAEALTHFNKSILLDADPEVFLRRAQLFEKMGELVAAQKDRDQAAKRAYHKA